MAESRRTYVPGAGLHWLLPFYDPLAKVLGVTSARRELLELAGIVPGERVLDIGCGTGDLVVLVKQAFPETEVLGLDPDPKALERARRKAARCGVSVGLQRGFADALPFPDAAFDRVLSSFVLHHLPKHEKTRALSEARRVLRSGGSLHLLDFGGPDRRADGLFARLLNPTVHLGDNFEGRIPRLLAEAGFEVPREVAHRSTALGRVGYYFAETPR